MTGALPGLRRVLALAGDGPCTGLSHDGTAFVQLGEETLNCRDDTGRVLWSVPVEGAPAAVAWGPDGGEVFTLRSGRVVVRDGDTGTPVGEGFMAPPDAHTLAVSPDGLRVACAGGGVLVHHRATHASAVVPAVDPVVAPAWDPQGRQLCLATATALQLWSVAPVRMDFAPSTGRTGVTALAWSPDRDALAFADVLGVHLVDRATGRLLAEVPSPGGVLGLGFSRTGRFLVVGTDQDVVLVFDRALEEVARLPARLGSPRDLGVSPTGRVLFAAPGGTELWELPDAAAYPAERRVGVLLRGWAAAMCRSVGRSLPSLRDHAPRVGTPSPLHDAGTALRAPAFAWTATGGRCVLETAPGTLGALLPGRPGALWSAPAATGPGGAHDLELAPAPYALLACASRDGRAGLTLLDAGSGAQRAVLAGGQAPAWCPEPHRDGAMLAVPEPGPGPTHLYVHTVDAAGNPAGTPHSLHLPQGTGRPGWAPDGRLLGAGTLGAVVLWHMPEPARARRLELPSGAFATRVAFSPDGSRLAATPAAGQGPLVVWSTLTWRVQRELGTPGGRGWAPALAWSPDGSLLAAPGPGEGTAAVQVWDVARGTLAMTLEPDTPPGPLWSVRWSPDGRRLATTYTGGRTLLWPVLGSGGRPEPGPGLPESPEFLAEAGAMAAAVDAAVPLSALAELSALLSPTPPAHRRALHRGTAARALRDLGWPRHAHPALGAVVASRLRPDPRYAPPPGVPLQELRTTLEWGLRGGGEPAERTPVTGDDLSAALDRTHRELLPLLALLGPDAVAQDPALPLRLADVPWARAAAEATRRTGLPPRLPVAHGDDVPGPATAGAPAQWARHGPPDRMVPAQMALPGPLLNALWAQDALLYRTRRGRLPFTERDAVLVLDTSAAAHGQVGSCLRLSAHLLATALMAAGHAVALVRLDARDAPVRLAAPADLRRLWTPVRPEPADPVRAAALARRAARGLSSADAAEPRTLLLTHPHEPPLPLPGSLTLRVHYPRHPVAPDGPDTWVLAPEPGGEELRRVLTAVLARL
ncbi:WD40 repeat protein [Streptomyces sp. SAI-170]|uniref:WD40 repeat domain-containing protein n=1 Tax=Streptomyces sp. SAI-170 TaxID=3377729 RepID=UPI003C7AF98A